MYYGKCHILSDILKMRALLDFGELFVVRAVHDTPLPES